MGWGAGGPSGNSQTAIRNGLDYFNKKGGSDAPFQEEYYMSNNPDVKSAVEKGEFVSGSQHFQMHGYQEGRVGYSAPPAAPAPKPPKPQQNQQQVSTPNPSAVNNVRKNAKNAKGKRSTLLSQYGSSRSRSSGAQASNTAALGLASSTKKTLLGAA